jgi:hypothetical protein
VQGASAPRVENQALETDSRGARRTALLTSRRWMNVKDFLGSIKMLMIFLRRMTYIQQTSGDDDNEFV